MSLENRVKTALITGGTDGIGQEVACGLARLGCPIVIVGRDRDKGNRAKWAIRHTTGNADVEFFRADLSMISEVSRLAGEIANHWSALRYLVHSAGVVCGRRELTSEGLESNFAINYLSRFALSQLLMPLLKTAGRVRQTARIVIVGGAAQNGTIHFKDVNLTRNFATLRAVSQFCQANDVFTIELARRLAAADAGNHVTITSLKIGVVKTNIRREFPLWMKVLVPLVMDPLLGQTRQEAAASVLRLLLAQEFEGISGALFLKIKRFRSLVAGAPARDPETGRRLWELSERFMNTIGSSAGVCVSPVPARIAISAKHKGSS